MFEYTVGGDELGCFRSAILVRNQPGQASVDIEVRVAEIEVDLRLNHFAPVVVGGPGAEVSAELIRSVLRGD